MMLLKRTPLLLLIQLVAVVLIHLPQLNCQDFLGPIQVTYDGDGPKLKMTMNDTRELGVTLKFDKKIIQLQKVDLISVQLVAKTQSPQFDILSILDGTGSINIPKRALEAANYNYKAKIKVHANYIGHATISLSDAQLIGTNKAGQLDFSPNPNILQVTIEQSKGIWEIIFFISVTLLMIISYVNMGAQLDRENLDKMLKKPKTVIIGFLITVLTMPIISWSIGYWLLGDQMNYRIGSFVFACGPAATASTLWTVMLDCDKELAVGLQIASTIGALVTMPILLYLIEATMNLEVKDMNTITRIPYGKLIGTFLGLLIALYLGWRFIGQNEKARKISTRIFRPLTIFVLIYIIVFSSIVYWHIYYMFSWKLTFESFLITVFTYIICGLLGYLIDYRAEHNLERAVAVSITGTYKNSGIAIAVLMVIFENPDYFIAFVPCLTQVLTTSLMLYSIYCIVNLINYLRRRNQPEPITAATSDDAKPQDEPNDEGRTSFKKVRSGSSGSAGQRSLKSEQNEFIPMNVTDVEAPESINSTTENSQTQQVGEDKVAIKDYKGYTMDPAELMAKV